MAELPGPALGRIRRSRPPFVPAPSTPLSDAVMEEPVGPFHLLRAETGRFLCYCGPDGTVFVTDAMEVWAGELGGCPVRGCRCSPEERGAMLRAALGHGAAALSLGPDSAMLRLPEEPRCPALALAQLPAAEARSQLQALIFGMAGCIESLERRLEALRRTLSGASSSSCQTPAPGRVVLLAQLCQPKGRSMGSLSLTLVSKARGRHLE
ncbi:protein PAXX isoform X4 [Poecile atricapillus]|uniref:protein PAXX isoform X4 n=1 Tax=Poecile atricapillus TaxID=48891 RepID=UPI00273875AE|nr:protein PAXX isoform X4 [Poecile atricapillus]